MNRHLQILACALIFVAQTGFGAAAGTESQGATQGVYSYEKSYQPAPLPRFAEIRDRLPSPIFEERPEWVSMYWKSWELAFKNFHEPAPGSGYVLLNHLAIMGEVFQKTGTVWENYAPDAPAPGRPAKSDFVGWSGIGPILYLLEFAVGLKPDAGSNTLVWEVASAKPLGVERFRFNGHVVSLRAESAGGGWTVAQVVSGLGPALEACGPARRTGGNVLSCQRTKRVPFRRLKSSMASLHHHFDRFMLRGFAFRQVKKLVLMTPKACS